MTKQKSVVTVVPIFGSMPGKLLQKMAKVGVKNPLFLLDEIDKMSSTCAETLHQHY
ncbi:hypothetical protein ACLK1S_02730 [Escherichia coli]